MVTMLKLAPLIGAINLTETRSFSGRIYLVNFNLDRILRIIILVEPFNKTI